MNVLYSYRRCPYAMRARMAVAYAGITLEIREIALRDKPKHMLQVSPKGTVPVLVLEDGTVIDESLDIMYWALQQQDLGGWLQHDGELRRQLITENDSSFKVALDAYKYFDRFPEKTQIEHRVDGEVFLKKLETLLQHRQYLQSSQTSMVDIALFPFIRQFAGVDAAWFEMSPYPKLQAWLKCLVTSELFLSIMQKRPTYIE
jgi:glutathione S-transferase